MLNQRLNKKMGFMGFQSKGRKPVVNKVIRSSNNALDESWDIDPVDALRVNTLSAEQSLKAHNTSVPKSARVPKKVIQIRDNLPVLDNHVVEADPVSSPEGSTIIAPNEDVAVNVTVDLQEDDCSSLPMKMVEHIVNKSTVKKSEVITHQNAKGVGIFSDSRMYSAMIQSELKGHNVNIRHFNHPKTFTETSYSFFDEISAWIVFLSEDGDNDLFLDKFLERYSDKPVMFVFEKTPRKKTTEKFNAFLAEHQLVSK